MEIDFTFEYFKKYIYWTICKFKEDEFHYGIVGKRDLIGGFFDRWLNRAPEFLIFDKLLQNRSYSIVLDNFLYGQDTEKNSPDVIGIKTNEGRIIKFTEFVDGGWKHIEGMPFIEVKTFRKDQKLVNLWETQYNEYHYYVFVESNVIDDYITALFQEELFADEIFDSLKTPEDFIKSDSKQQIITPKKLKRPINLGFFKLIGIFKGGEVKNKCMLVEGGRNPQKPLTLESIESVPTAKIKDRKNINSGFWIYQNDKNEQSLPMMVKLEENSVINIVSDGTLTIYIQVMGMAKINGKPLEEGFYKIKFKRFDKSSSKSEYMGYKCIFENDAEDVTNELIGKFDAIYHNRISQMP